MITKEFLKKLTISCYSEFISPACWQAGNLLLLETLILIDIVLINRTFRSFLNIANE